MADTPVRRTGRPTLDEAAALQQTILDETLRMVSTSGAEGFSVDQLATRIAVTKRTIYRHYKTKNGLIIAVVTREIDRLLEKSERGLDDANKNPIMRLRTWIKVLFDYIYTPQAIAFIRFLTFEEASSTEIAQQSIKWHNHLLNHGYKMIADAQRCGLMREGDVHRFGLLLFDMVTGIHSRARPEFGLKDILGGDDPEHYFEFRWMGFLSLVSPHPWANFISLAGGGSGLAPTPDHGSQ